MEQFEISGSGLIDFVRYEGNQATEFTNVFFPLSIQYTGERSQIGLTGSISRDNTLQGELLETGVVNVFRQRDQRKVNPTWAYSLTERLQVHLGYQFIDVDYEESGNQLFPYQSHTGTGGLGYLLSETTSIDGSLLYGTFHVLDQGFRSNYYGLQVQASHALSETFDVSALGGIRRVQNSLTFLGQTQREYSNAWIAKGTMKYQLDVMTLQGSISRELSPSGLGLLVQTDRVQSRISHNITESLQLHISGSYFWVTAVGSQTQLRPFSNRDFWRVGTGFQWQLDEWWYLDGLYRHQQRKERISSIESTGNLFSLSLTFRGWSFSTAQ